MSSCLILQCKNKLYIGSDTSSSIFIKDKLYRLNNHTKKLFKLNNSTIMYCAGNNLIAKIVAQHISSIFNRPDFSFEDLKKWLKQNYPYRNKKKTIYDVEILIATFSNENTIVYQISQYNNYEIVKFEINNLGVQILSAGIKNKECMDYAEIELTKNHSIESIYYNTFCNLSCNYIGGNLDLYEVSKDGIVTIFNNKKINELGIQYINEILNNHISVSINAEVLMSKLVMSENLWIENDSGTYKFNDDGFIAKSGNNSVRIQPNQSGELFSIYKGNNKQFYVDADGNVHFTGDLSGATGTFSGLVSGGSINIGNGTFLVDGNGNMTANSGKFGGTLDGANGTFSGNVTAYSGVIGGWKINNSSLSSKDGTVQLSNDGIISGATITGANGSFTEGFSVELPEKDYNALTAQFILKTTSDGIFIGLKPSEGGTYGFRMRNGNVYISGIPTSMNSNDPNHLVYVNGKRAATLSDVPTSTSKMPATYTSSNSKLIKFDGASADYCGATPAWVKSYVRGQIPSNYITGFSGDNISGVYNSIRTSGNTIVGSKISYSDLRPKVSDMRLKKDVSDVFDISDFYMNLKPTVHRYKTGSGIGEDDKLQFGLIAQWTEHDMRKNKLNPSIYSLIKKTKPFADTEQSKYTNGDDVYNIDYDQFHAMHIYMIQKQQKEIEEIKEEIRELKGI